MANSKKLLVIQVAALGHDFVCRGAGAQWKGLSFQPMDTVFPAVTCAAQATFRTALAPSAHGMVANGFLSREFHRVFFWEQSADLVSGPRIYEKFRRAGGRVAVLFWQQSLGESADCLLSPAPIHRHHGGMIQDCCGKPDGLYARLCDAVGRPFKLQHYWGPFASTKCGDWIAEATAALLADTELAPDLCLTYLPTLDYDLQRFGPDHPKSRDALASTLSQLELLFDAAKTGGYELLIFGDYAIGAVDGPAFPNRVLREAGLMKTRAVKGMLYPDLHESRAFAVVDHEVAHVYVKRAEDVDATRGALEGSPGVAEVLDRAAQVRLGCDHPRSGDVVLVASPGKWLAYPWWKEPSEAPDYATHVDIHNKPGYDPAELFSGTFPWQVSTDASRLRGSHGRVSPGRRACWASSLALGKDVSTLAALSSAVRTWLEKPT